MYWGVSIGTASGDSGSIIDRFNRHGPVCKRNLSLSRYEYDRAGQTGVGDYVFKSEMESVPNQQVADYVVADIVIGACSALMLADRVDRGREGA